MQIDTWTWSHTCWGHMVLIGPQVCKWVKFYIFRLSYKFTLHDLWPLFVTFDLMNMWRFLHYINKPSLVPIGIQLFKWGEFYIFSPSYNLTSDNLWPWYTFDLGRPLTTWKNKGSCIVSIKPNLVAIALKLFKWGQISFQPILQLDLRWPLTLICDIWPHQPMRVCMLHLWTNFGWNPSKHVEGRAKC